MAVTRSYAGAAAGVMGSGTSVTILGGAAMEGAAAELGRQVKKVPMYNFTQIFRDPFDGSATLQASDLYGDEFLAEEAVERGIEHQKYIELACLFGARNGNASFAGAWDDEAAARRHEAVDDGSG
jgi:hypothetical protein